MPPFRFSMSVPGILQSARVRNGAGEQPVPGQDRLRSQGVAGRDAEAFLSVASRMDTSP